MVKKPHWIPLLIFAAIWLYLYAGMGYGESVFQARVTHHAWRQDMQVFAISVHYRLYRPAAGLRAFPDGGVPLVIAEGAAIYVCAPGHGTIERRAVLPRPAIIKSAFEPWIAAWKGDMIGLIMTGYSGLESHSELAVRQGYLIDSNGQAKTVPVEELPQPEAATSLPRQCSDLAESDSRQYRDTLASTGL